MRLSFTLEAARDGDGESKERKFNGGRLPYTYMYAFPHPLTPGGPFNNRSILKSHIYHLQSLASILCYLPLPINAYSYMSPVAAVFVTLNMSVLFFHKFLLKIWTAKIRRRFAVSG